MTRASDAPLIVENAAALVIGSELLSGKIRDENLFALSQTLRALGIRLDRVIICPDDKATITRDVAQLRQHHDIVFTSGGVGPTHDDVTIEGVAEALGVPVTESAGLRTAIERHYAEKTSDVHLLMARTPQGAMLVESESVRWPTIVADNVWILPGVPELFRMKLMVVRERLRGPIPFFTEIVLCRLEETEIKAELDEVVAAHPRCEVGSYPKWFEPRFKTKLTVDARSASDARQAALHLIQLLGDRVATPD